MLKKATPEAVKGVQQRKRNCTPSKLVHFLVFNFIPSSTTESQEMDEIKLSVGSSSVTVRLHGATVVSWVCDGVERLFVRCATMLCKQRPSHTRTSPAHGRSMTASKPFEAAFPWCFRSLGLGRWAQTMGLRAFRDGAATQ